MGVDHLCSIALLYRSHLVEILHEGSGSLIMLKGRDQIYNCLS